MAFAIASWASAFSALGHFGATRAANFLYLTPAVATALSIVLTDERPGIETVCGGLLAIAGVIFVALRGRT
ncbi:protein of unknown function DUF6, transmembrane [Burkholderia ambifaria MEX-5]|uniref:EamA domain-containing protein n=1 Tax=Burkholderia ambifaria MEX-5 TaxID=396597 RepID=B1SYB0_9BURK|nr:protein of unknown function DUF6, transmembrane [Burkholderia ambifaria MEX-5]